jgi:[ribosomal protein S5]-alanine N-acetyltransferase
MTPALTPALTAAQATLHTRRLQLQGGATGPDAALAHAVCDFQCRNAAHFAPWDPPTPPAFFTLAGQTDRLAQSAQAWRAGTALRYWLSPVDQPGRVIGMVHLSQISRGAFCSASLGYALDQGCQGRGLMTEALQAVVMEAFSPRVNLHRLQAAFRPENQRSAAVLSRLGFVPIGLSRDYLYIDGAWRDHQLCDLLNPQFQPPSSW